MQLLTRAGSSVIPLPGARLASGINGPDGASHTPVARHVDVVEMMHGRVYRAVSEGISDMCLGLSGEFDIYNKCQLAATLASNVAYPAITIDLAQTRFIDAGIIGVFARFAGLRRELGASQLRIVNANKFICKLFSICRLGTLFCIEEQPHA